MNENIVRCQKLLEQFPENELARFSLGKAFFDSGDFALAKKQFELALVRKPDWMVAQILMGKCELALGHMSEAKISFEQARQLAAAQDHKGPLAEMEQALAELI